MNWFEVEKKFFLPVFKRFPVVLVRGEGAWVWDDQGKRYLDFIGGWAVNSLGHCHPAVAEALSQQARKLIHTSNQVYTIPQLELAQLLVKHSCLDKAFFCNSGAEANEAAVKLARKYGKLKLGGAFEVISALNSFHGRTLAMVAATGQAKFQEPFIPLPDGFVNVEFSDVEAIKSATNPKTCAVLLEPIQGEGGVVLPSEDYFRQVRKLCDEKGLLLILDEIQTGIGRTGTLFAYEQLGIEPDILTLAKGLGSGVPIGAVLVKEKASVFSPGDHGSTFGGNPLVCAAALATLRFILENQVLENVRRVGQYLLDQLARLRSKFGLVREVRGRGLLAAIEFERDLSEEVVRGCLERGLLLNPVRANAIRFMPPLIIGEAEVDRAVGILEEVLAQLVT